ncbi:MAG: tetratricopeptide repeat protein [Acidobacteriota bacterium]|nr:tetratricopeptide repeat protein [Acidobacteriota bacterium]
MIRLLYAALLGAALAWGPARACAATTPESCRGLRLHGREGEALACFESLRRSGDPYRMAEGLWGLGRWEEAKQEFEKAVGQPNAPALWTVRYGMLFHERFNNAEAAKLFAEALHQDPANALAYVGLATLGEDGFDGRAAESIAKAIELDPKLAEAHSLAADLALEEVKPDEAVKEAESAIALSPYHGGSDALDAFAVRAAEARLGDRTAESEAWLGKVQAVNPHYGRAYAIVARHLFLNRRYTDAVEFDRKAIAADPALWSARSDLGINLTRLGEEEEPRMQLELAYNHGQTDAATSNSLRLLDSYRNFVTTRDASTILRMRKDEADLLRPYFEQQLHTALATYTAKYKVTLGGPVQLEVYPDHEDFAVRTMGMPGLGALGVTFGTVVAMDSPSGRKPGDFNWGATLWHELSHVFILTATDHRVPRWFTEGLAVHEEGQANPEWANRLTPEVVLAIRDKKLLPVAQLDRGFIFPEYPEQVLVSYWQAGTICDFVQQQWGADALLGMVHAFAQRKTTAEAIADSLHLSPGEFDARYKAWVERRAGATAAGFDTWRTQLKALAAMAAKGQNEAVMAAAPALITLYPEYIGDANAYELLASAQLAKGNKQAAVRTLSAYVTEGGQSPEALKRLSGLQSELGDTKAAAATLDRLNFVYPEDEALHRQLGGLWLAQGNAAGAVREYRAVLALKPLDRAAAQYDLARAYMAAGDRASAEESVLASLEAAPGFRQAQALLLELQPGAPHKQTEEDRVIPNGK